jgi:hypothetical protein
MRDSEIKKTLLIMKGAYHFVGDAVFYVCFMAAILLEACCLPKQFFRNETIWYFLRMLLLYRN